MYDLPHASTLCPYIAVYLKALTYLNILRPTKRKARDANTHCVSRLVTRKGMMSRGEKMEARSR